MSGNKFDRRDVLSLGGAAMLAAALPPAAAAAADDRKRVLFFTKSSGYEHQVVHRELYDVHGHAEQVLVELGRSHGFDVTVTKDGTVFDGDLDQWDAFVFYTSGVLTLPGNDKTPPMSPEGKKRLLDAVAAGKGFVGSHCASDSFHTPGDRFSNQEEKDPYIAMLGGEFIRHGQQQAARMTVADTSFPGMDAAADGFTMHEEWYSLKNFADDLHVLLINETEGMEGKDYQRPPFPATWARRHGKGRVFYTSMGHRPDVWTNPLFQAILVGAVHWATRQVEAEIRPNILEVTRLAHVMPPE